MTYQRIPAPSVRSPKAGVPSGRQDKQNLKPTNERLWHMLVVQAKAKFVKFPSPTASAWVHHKYVQMGGRFVDTHKEAQRKRAVKAAKDIADKHREARKKHKRDGHKEESK